MKSTIRIVCLAFNLLACSISVIAKDFDSFVVEQNLQSAFVRVDGDQLIANTGKVERRWKPGKAGLLTSDLIHLGSNKNWADLQAGYESDWEYQNFTGKGELVSLHADISDDEGFTNQHIQLIAEFHYAKLAVKYIVWVYPNSEGFRTQLKVKKRGSLGSKTSEYDLTTHSDFNKQT